MKMNQNTFVNKIVKYHYLIVKVSKNNFCAQICYLFFIILLSFRSFSFLISLSFRVLCILSLIEVVEGRKSWLQLRLVWSKNKIWF